MIFVRQYELDCMSYEHPKDGKCPKCGAVMQKDEDRMFPERLTELQGPTSPSREVTPCTNYVCEPCNVWIDVLDRPVEMKLEE